MHVIKILFMFATICFTQIEYDHPKWGNMDIRVTTIYLPYQDLGKNRCLLIYKTDVRKEIFHNIAIYDQQDHLKIWPKSTKIAYLGEIFTFFRIKVLNYVKLTSLVRKHIQFSFFHLFYLKFVIFGQIFKWSCWSYIAIL